MGSCPNVGENRAQPLCRSAAPALTRAHLREAGASVGRGCLGPQDGLGWVWSVLPGLAPLHRLTDSDGGGGP